MAKYYFILCTILYLSLLNPAILSAGDIQQELSSESMIERVIRKGTLKVGMSTFLPWAMKDKTG